MSYQPKNSNGQATMANSQPMVIASDQSAVPVSASSLPLPTGASTATKQDTGNTSLASIDGKITAVNTGAVVVSSSVLPTGAATAAKQPALGIAGTSSADVLTVQGRASMTPILIDGSATTQPVSASSLPLPTGASTSANQTTGNSSLSTIATNTGAGATSANQTNGAQKGRVTDGTNDANVLKSDGTAAGQNAQLQAGTYLSVPFTTTTVAAVASTDVGNYRWVSVHITTQGTSSTVTFQSSNDNTNWVSTPLLLSTSTTGSTNVVSSTTAGVLFHGPLTGRYFRLNVTGISALTTAGTVIFSTLPAGPSAQSVAATQLGTWTVQPGNTQNTTPWLMSQVGATSANGWTPYSLISAATTNANNVKASAGVIGTMVAMNTSATAKYIHVYNTAGTPTAGSGTPVQRYLVPAGGGFSLPAPLYMSSGIGFTITGGAADADTTSIAAGDVLLNMGWL